MTSTQAAALRVDTICNPADLSRMAAEWDGLAATCPTASIFQTWEWVDAWWRHFGRGRHFLLFQIWCDDLLVGIAPFAVKRHLRLPLKKLEFIGTGLSDTLDILLYPDLTDHTFPLLKNSIERSQDLWDLADFQQMPEGSPVLKMLGTGSVKSTLEIRPFPQEVCPVVSLPGSWEEYASRLGKKMRYNIGYYERLMSREFRLEIGAADEESLDAEMDAFFDLHRNRWHKKRLPGVLRNSSVQRFHRDVARRFLRRGWLRLYYLKLDGITRASLYCFHFQKKACYYLGGFDPDLGRYSPGTVLTAYAIREAIAAGMEEFDFLRGHESYKYRWEPANRVNSRLLVIKPGIRSRLMARLNAFERQVEVRVKERVEKWQERK